MKALVALALVSSLATAGQYEDIGRVAFCHGLYAGTIKYTQQTGQVEAFNSATNNFIRTNKLLGIIQRQVPDESNTLVIGGAVFEGKITVVGLVGNHDLKGLNSELLSCSIDLEYINTTYTSKRL